MKKYMLILAMLITTGISAFAQKDEDAIKAVMNTQVKEWNNGNIEAFMQTYWNNDSLLFVSSKGPTYGWKTTLEHYKKSYPDTSVMGKLDFDILEVKLLSPTNAFVLGKWHLTRTMGDIGGYYTLLFRKINGRWLIVVDHTS